MPATGIYDPAVVSLTLGHLEFQTLRNRIYDFRRINWEALKCRRDDFSDLCSALLLQRCL